jgi:hypothetical protein
LSCGAPGGVSILCDHSGAHTRRRQRPSRSAGHSHAASRPLRRRLGRASPPPGPSPWKFSRCSARPGAQTENAQSGRVRFAARVYMCTAACARVVCARSARCRYRRDLRLELAGTPWARHRLAGTLALSPPRTLHARCCAGALSASTSDAYHAVHVLLGFVA